MALKIQKIPENEMGFEAEVRNGGNVGIITIPTIVKEMFGIKVGKKVLVTLNLDKEEAVRKVANSIGLTSEGIKLQSP